MLRPPLNKKSFPVHRPGGIILRLYPAAFFFFFFFFKLKYFSYFSSDFQTVFTIVCRMIRRMHKKKYFEKKSISRPPGWFYFTPPGPQETIFYLRVALGHPYGNVVSSMWTRLRHSSANSKVPGSIQGPVSCCMHLTPGVVHNFPKAVGV